MSGSLPGRGLSRRWKQALVLALVAAALLVVAVVTPPWTVRSLDEVNATSGVAGDENLDPVKYVDAIWASRLLPTVEDSAVDLGSLLGQLRESRRATVEKYGNVASLGGSPAFLAKSSGRIVSVDTQSLISTAGISIDSDQKADVFMQIGPILSGTDVRDALRFIDFNQFVNQVQYEEIGVEINSRIRDSVLSKLDPATLKGKTVQLAGAFTYTDPKRVVLMPVTLEVTSG